ncbi:MAG TPA: phage protease, partial [Polyangiaceae bacterium]|nr:phage protease [Polyangiaceae bacterium]
HAHPQFHAGPDGVGDKPTIPFDYEHASELSATEGSIPTSGAPAPAWVLDLEVRDGSNGPELWALAALGDQIRQQIAANEYRFTSIAFTLDGTDGVSGASVGPMLTSIAFTNHPFLRGLKPLQIAASARGLAARRVLLGPPVANDATEPADEEGGYDRPAVNLTGTNVDVAAPDAIDQAIEHFKLDPRFAALSRAEQIAYAAACLELTKKNKAERTWLEPDQEGNPTMSTNENPCGLTDEEFAICRRSKTAFSAAHQILALRDRAYAARPDLPQHCRKAHALEQELEAAETEYQAAFRRCEPVVSIGLANAQSVAPPRVAVTPMPKNSITLEQLRALYPGANDVLKAVEYMRQVAPPFAKFPWDQQVKRAADFVRSLLPTSSTEPAVGGVA